ncbi:MAG: peptide ABC transporter substrate-binding protein [Ardenticatenaceae bacterium]|nr:peptide ABC transporter substrate-binding protein [Ardenticatenaceae bacterium]MCB9443744.1 peptide ABC transporter substrate-binding protein [Ardenticatenaceae bacterium]
MTKLHPRSPAPLRLILFFFVASLLLFNCQVVERALQSRTAVTDATDTIRLIDSQPRTLDPALTLGGPDGPLGHIFSGLVSLDTNLQIQPELAAGWTVSDDGLLYTFYLRQNAVFHNGRVVAAADVIYSWERAADPTTGSDTVLTYLGDIDGLQAKYEGRADHISGLRLVDDHTLEVRLNAPVVYFLQKLAYPVAYVVDEQNVAETDWEHHPNGTGPFRLDTWRDDDVMILLRNDNYYLEPAHIGRLVYNLGPGLPLSMYETDEIDLVGIGGDTLARALDPNDSLSADLRMGVSMCTSVIGLNNRLAPFDDVRVRQAFNYALDKQLLIETFADGNGLVATGPLPPGMPGYTGKSAGYPYDPERARQLMADAGYANPADFPVITYTTAGYGDVGDYVTAVITMWQKNLGITIQPVVLDPFTYYDELYDGNIGHLFSSGWCADYPDPQNFLDVLYHSDAPQNLGGYSNLDVDRQLEQARVERDVSVRMALYGEIEQEIVADAPVVFASHGVTAVLVKPRVQNYVLTPIGVVQWQYVSLRP